VSFAGRVGRNGLTASVRCGPFVASLVRLRQVAVAEGERVGVGERIGEAGPRVHLGVRRGGYVDPLLLLPAPPLGPAPPPLTPGVRHAPVPARHAPPAPPPPGLPVVVLGGLALLAISVPSLAVVRARRRRGLRQAHPGLAPGARQARR
jgi:hypothetical protein